MSVIILYSGGLDSRIMLRLAEVKGIDAKCVFFDIGQPYADKEKAALPSFVDVRKVDWLRSESELRTKSGSSSGNIYILGRNLTLACLASSIYCASEVWLGALAGETEEGDTDKNNTFLQKSSDALTYVFSPFIESIRITLPLADEKFDDKLSSVRWALDNGLTPDDLMATSSCLSGCVGNCGTCIVCLRRWGVFGQMGFSEKYNVDPLTAIENKQLFIDLLLDRAHFREYHKTDIRQYLFQLFPNKSPAEIAERIRS